MEQCVNVIGAGLAGCEATYQLIKKGFKVKLYEMRPTKSTPAHKSPYFSELVCSNSLRADGLANAVGVLKEEMTMLDSLIIKYARKNAVPAGGSLAVDREGFSKDITDYLKSHPLVEIVEEEVEKIFDGPTIIATGPLTSSCLASQIQNLLGDDYFYFFDAAAPIVSKDSIDFTKAYFKSRYDKSDATYINCPMTETEFNLFYDELIHAQVVKPKDYEEKFFEGCMPFEEIARRGRQTLLFGPMKPVGLEKEDGTRPYAVVQLRQDNAIATLYNIVGFQTHLTWPEQKRILSLVPGLENVEIVRYGVMHRNCYICAPKYLLPTYQYKKRKDLFFAGQITGVEGYVESASSGIVAGLNMARYLQGKSPIIFDDRTVIGALSSYITNGDQLNFQPMKANFGILRDLDVKVKKKEKKEAYALRAIEVMNRVINEQLD